MVQQLSQRAVQQLHGGVPRERDIKRSEYLQDLTPRLETVTPTCCATAWHGVLVRVPLVLVLTALVEWQPRTGDNFVTQKQGRPCLLEPLLSLHQPYVFYVGPR